MKVLQLNEQTPKQLSNPTPNSGNHRKLMLFNYMSGDQNNFEHLTQKQPIRAPKTKKTDPKIKSRSNVRIE